MYTLRQSVFVKGSAGDPLPKVWDSIEQGGTQFLRGQLVLVCAAPGIGKSGFILTYALRAKVPTLYFSADSDAFTQATRAISILTGKTMELSKTEVRTGRLDADSVNALDQAAMIQFEYHASPSLKQIKDSLDAFHQKWGSPPSLIVIDNITDVFSGIDNNADDPFSGLEGLMGSLHELARESGSCVIGLHHVTGDYNNGNIPIPLRGIKGQIGRVPEMVLTLHRIGNEFGPDEFNVSTVKNRAGKSDTSGLTFVSMDFTGDTMQIVDAA